MNFFMALAPLYTACRDQRRTQQATLRMMSTRCHLQFWCEETLKGLGP